MNIAGAELDIKTAKKQGSAIEDLFDGSMMGSSQRELRSRQGIYWLTDHMMALGISAVGTEHSD